MVAMLPVDGGAWMLPVLHRVLLGGEPEGVVAHGVQHVAPVHPHEAGEDVGADVAERVTDVQALAARVREHVEHVELVLVGRGRRSRRSAARSGSAPRTCGRAPSGPATWPRSRSRGARCSGAAARRPRSRRGGRISHRRRAYRACLGATGERIPRNVADTLNRSGAVAQLVERLHGMEEVVGSSPISSTGSPSPRRNPDGHSDQRSETFCGSSSPPIRGTTRPRSRRRAGAQERTYPRWRVGTWRMTVQSDATTVEEYLEIIPADPRETIAAVRDVILEHLPGGFVAALAIATRCEPEAPGVALPHGHPRQRRRRLVVPRPVDVLGQAPRHGQELRAIPPDLGLLDDPVPPDLARRGDRRAPLPSTSWPTTHTRAVPRLAATAA